MRRCLFVLKFVMVCMLLPASGSGLHSPDQPENLEKLLKDAVYGNGYIYHSNDSTPCEILICKKRYKSATYQYCIVRQPNDSVIVYTPKEIDGYKINRERYTKHVSGGKSFFIQLLKSGKVSLYSRGGIPYDIKFLFYLKVPGERDLLVICPQDNDISLTGSKDSRDSPMMIYRSKDSNEKFIAFVYKYFRDCPQVIDKVDSGFYTMNELPTLVEEYNHCN